MAEVRLTYDAQAQAAYVHVSAKAVARTVELVVDQVSIDLDADGALVGVEALHIAEDSLGGLITAVHRVLGLTERELGPEAGRLLSIA